MKEMIEQQDQGEELNKISLVDFQPSTIDQQMVVQFIEENPDLSCYFDASWFVLNKDLLYELYGLSRDLFMSLLDDLRLVEARFDRVEEIKDSFYLRLVEARKVEHERELNDRVIPNHPNKFPRFLWEEETRHMRTKDKEFADLMASTGNKDAHKWYQARQEKRTQATNKLDNLVARMDNLIDQKKEI